MTVMDTVTGLMTFAEFVSVPDPATGHHELHHGQLVLMPRRKKSHATIQQALLDLLSPLVQGRGFITIEFPFRPAPEYQAWQADVAFVSQERWEQDDNEYFLGAPDFVVEVLSASNTMEEILDRQEVCFANGCSTFWTPDAKRRTVMVTTADRKTVTYEAFMDVPLPANVAEAVIPVAAIFL